MRSLIFTALALGALASGCSDLSDYEGRWEADMVIGDDRPDFILTGFPVDAGLILDDFDPTPEPEGASPGTLTTTRYDAFTDTPLEVIAPLAHDQLSQYDFPGQGRVRNYIYASRPTAGPLAGRDAMVFVSLIDDDTLEVRVLVGNGDQATGGHFGLWHLTRPSP